jgi:beta-phosphoglucomutase-like phosphatase (HAD superfamily)
VIFDCDGVLVDSERLVVRIDALVLSKMGWPLTEKEIVERFVADGPQPSQGSPCVPSLTCTGHGQGCRMGL